MKDWFADSSGAALFVFLFFLTFRWRERFSAKVQKTASVALGQQAIQTGNSEIVVAGGMESMTNAPYPLQNARKGFRLGDQKVVDSMVHDGLWDAYNDYHMGNTGENVAVKYGITREEQDEYAVNSHRKAVSAIKVRSLLVPAGFNPVTASPVTATWA